MTLRFTLARARWVAGACWYPRQRGCLLGEGSCELKLPYAQDTELLMNILKLGTDCTVLSPQELCERVVAEVRRMNDACATPAP